MRRKVIGRIAKWVAIGAGAVLVLCAISAAIVAPRVFRAADDGREALIEASRAVLRRDAAVARVEFSAARDLFASATDRIDSPFSLPLKIVPVARTHVGVARSLSRIGTSVSEAGLSIADTMERMPEQSLAFRNGTLDLGIVRQAGDALSVAADATDEIQEAISVMPSGWVTGSLASPRAQVRAQLPAIVDGIGKAEAALAGLPSILAEGASKRYLVAFSNLSELRGSGGLFGFVTSLRASNGDLDLEAFTGRPTEVFPEPGDVGLAYPDWFPEDFRTEGQIFQNINMSTDFPTVGRLVTQTAEAELGNLDGVFAVDAEGIGAILGLVGPIQVPAWPTRITAENVAKIATHDVYVSITDGQKREVFFEQLVRTAFDRLTSTTVRLSPATAGAFDKVVRGGHFRMYSDHEADQATFDRIGAAGSVARTEGATDVLSVVSENATGNKIDWYLRREIAYRVSLDPEALIATGSLRATFSNTAPAAGLPDYIIGSPLEGLPAGTNRQIVMVLREGGDQLESLVVDGDDVTVISEREAQLRAHRTTVDIPPQGRSELRATTLSEGAVRRQRDGGYLYRLHVLKQATPAPDFVQIEIDVPLGWEATGETRFLGDLSQDLVLEVGLRRTTFGSFTERFIRRPIRWVGRLF